MRRPPLARFTATVLTLGFLPFGGCDKKDEIKSASNPREDSPAASTPAPAGKVVVSTKPTTPAPLVSAETTSFDAVASRLDSGGSLYLYLSTEQWLSALSGQLTKWRELLITAAPTKDPAEMEQITRAFDVATHLVKKSGLEDVTGFGASSFAVERGVYRNKIFVHHYPGKGSGFMWTMLGKSTHPLATLDLLPADTAFAGFADLDVAQLIATVEEEVNASGTAEAKQGMNQALLQFSASFGMSLDDLLHSLGGGIGMVVTLDPTKTISVPIGDKPQDIPMPRAALIIEVKDDKLFQLIDKSVAPMPGLIRVDEPGLSMRTTVMPIMPPTELRATAAKWGNYLILATDDALVRNMIAAQSGGKGFKSTPEFAKLSAGLPQEGNGFQVVTQRLADTWSKYQGDIMKGQPGVTPDQLAMVQKFWGDNKMGASYSVTGHVDNGWLAVGKGTVGAGQLVAPLVIAPVAIAAGVAMPVFGSVQQKGKATKSLSNAKQIGTACRLYAVDNKGKFPPKLEALVPDYLQDASIFISPFAPDEKMGYTYTAGLTDTSDPALDLIEDKFSVASGQRVVVHVDCSGQVIPVKK